MDKLFTKTEYEHLLKTASWPDERAVSCDCAWMEELKELSRCFHAQPCCESVVDAASTGDGCSVFFSVFWPHIEESVKKHCAGHAVDINGLFAPEALFPYKTGFLEYCVGHWSSVCASVFRKAGYSPLQVCSDPGALQYIFNGLCFRDCCLAYPMFARFFAEYILSVKNELSELIAVLAARRNMVYTRLCDIPAREDTVPTIASLSGSVSDRHSGGRSVHIITFTDGKKAVYKPHSSQVDIAFTAWLDFLTDISGEERFETADTVDFGTCSFYRFVSPYLFQTREETVRFFYREGFLLGAVYSLGGRDLHSENIIAAKDPVIVDGESLVEALEPYSEKGYSVMSTTMLPLCSCQPGYHKEPCGACDTCKGDANLPVVNGKIYSAYDFPDEMMAGFKAAMDAIVCNMPAALETVRRLFTGVSTRKLILPSYSYEYTLLALNTPRRLCSASEAEHVLNILLERKAEKDAEIMQREARIKLEREAMRRLDIPILYVTLDAEAIDKVISGIENKDEKDLNQQLKYMRFLLDKESPLRRPYAGSEHANPEDTVLRKLAEETLESFSGVYHIAVPREDREPRFALGGTGFLEGKLGAAVALAGYLSCFEETGDLLCETIRLKLQDYLDGLARQKDRRKAFSILEPGLAEGMGGMLAGAYMLFRSGLIGDALFGTVAGGILNSTEQALDSGRVFSFSHSFLYGFNGLKYALDRICSLGGLSSELAGRTERVASRLGREIVYPEESAEEMLRAELDEAYRRFDSSFFVQELALPFPGLFFGTAGKLFRMCAERRRHFFSEMNPIFDFFHYDQEVL